MLSPQAAAYFTKKVKERVTKPLEIHFHSDFGMGVANTINAVLAGAEVIHSTVLGIGERAGNTPMEETVMALLTMYGIDVGIDYGKLNELSRLVRELSGAQVPSILLSGTAPTPSNPELSPAGTKTCPQKTLQPFFRCIPPLWAMTIQPSSWAKKADWTTSRSERRSWESL